MKKICISIFALLFIALTTHSQFNPVYNWYKMQSGTISDLNYGIANYIIGSNGTLLKTTNTGLNWTVINTGSSGNLKGFHILSSNILIAGSNGLILRSTNDGSSWNTIPSGTTSNLNSISRILASNYAAAGDGGLILYSSNGGVNWSPVTSGTTNQLNFIIGASPVIAGGNNGTIIRSTNFGVSWGTVTSGTTQNLNSIDILSSTAIAVGANGTVIRSTDGGLTWQQMSSGTSANLNSVDINSPNVFAAGNGVVIKSTDNGTTWSTLSGSFLPNLNWKSISAYNANEVIVAGPSGNIYRRMVDSLYAFQYSLDANNMRSFIWQSGVFNQNIYTNNTPGCEWPIGSGKFAIFTTGVTTAAYVNNSIRMAAASYKGELLAGYCVNGNYLTDSRFKLYKVDADRPLDSDWVNWGAMVPFGAPFTDINNNGVYEPAIDKPGMKDAKQTVFICMTDANPLSHTNTEGFGGGTNPLGAEYHLTAWAYNSDPFRDMQFYRWVVINKSVNVWDSTLFSLVSDPDLGDANDDYIGCDTTRNLVYAYNSDNMDGNGSGVSYGANPPATGTVFLNCSGGNSVLSSICYFTNSGSIGPICERDAQTPMEAYNFMKGVKKDGTPWVNIINNQVTKFCYSGDPETGTGWTEFSGRIENCGGLLTGTHVIPTPSGDRRTVMNYKPLNQKLNPGDSQVIMTVQLIARGSNNLNSVTLLKQLADAGKNLCQNGFVIGINPISSEVPNKFNLHQNYPNPFNPITKIKFDLPKSGNVVIKIYDAIGREITTLVNEKLNAGVYSVDWDGVNYPSGVYFYKLLSNEYTDTRKMVLVK